ncbi:piggyBac transposable element-derived protein 4-like [Bactrocera neohumeralis]|uniref:piggyBac transposable element-derived protein 4-like n=1 Tax=Bactrocera neohumeralis TaxID=98809 RepID=UPI002165207D|nr:piggyBac transposable element-derived protein 4-like [Bactrocera neohumeralis]
MTSRRNEYLSSAAYRRLTEEQRESYIQSLFDKICNDDAPNDFDSEDEEEIRINHIEIAVDDAEVSQSAAEVLPDYADYEDDEGDDEEVEENNELPAGAEKFVARDGTEWMKEPNVSRQVLRQNIIRERSGPARCTEMLSIEQTFKCFMNVEMADKIMRHTNKLAKETYNAYKNAHPNTTPKSWTLVSITELYTFFGILFMTGANHSNGEHVRDLWSVKNYSLYRATMGFNRFFSILRFLRFDDKNTRATRLLTDKAAPINELWTMINNNLAAHYKPSSCLTIDEQLFLYRGRTRFTQYIPSKPAKYGVKVWWICDATNAYPLHGQIYTGQTETGRETNQGERVVKDLSAKYQGSGRNIQWTICLRPCQLQNCFSPGNSRSLEKIM